MRRLAIKDWRLRERQNRQSPIANRPNAITPTIIGHTITPVNLAAIVQPARMPVRMRLRRDGRSNQTHKRHMVSVINSARPKSVVRRRPLAMRFGSNAANARAIHPASGPAICRAQTNRTAASKTDRAMMAIRPYTNISCALSLACHKNTSEKIK